MKIMSKLILFLFLVFCLNGTNSFSANSSAAGPENYSDYARKLLAANQPQAAEFKLSEGLVHYPRSINLYILRGGVRFDYLKNYDGALQDYNKALGINPKSHPKVYYRRGDIFFNKGMYAIAAKEYTKCLNLMPNYPKVYVKRAKAYVKIGQKEKAKADLIKAVKLDQRYRSEVMKFWADNRL